jgi:hypothetical protein
LSRVRGSVSNNNGLQLQSIIRAHNQCLSKTRSVPYWTTSVFCSAVTDLALIYESATCSASVVPCLTLHSWTLNSLTNAECRMPNDGLRANQSQIQSYVTTDGQSASLSWAYGQNFITVRRLRVCWCGALSLTRRRVCRLQLLLALTSAVIFSGPIPVGLATIFYCLRFETSLFVASYDSQGYGGHIRPRLHTGGEWTELTLL